MQYYAHGESRHGCHLAFRVYGTICMSQNGLTLFAQERAAVPINSQFPALLSFIPGRISIAPRLLLGLDMLKLRNQSIFHACWVCQLYTASHW